VKEGEIVGEGGVSYCCGTSGEEEGGILEPGLCGGKIWHCCLLFSWFLLGEGGFEKHRDKSNRVVRNSCMNGGVLRREGGGD
jgi:hypothetical protein